MNLYQINEEIMSCMDMETGEIIDSEKLDNLQMALEDKLENISLWVKNLEADAAAFKGEKEAFAARQKAAENKAASLKKYLSDFLDGQKFETVRVKVSFRKSESLEVSEDAKVPEEFMKHKAPEVNKAELKKAVKAGLMLEGVQLVEKQNIQIR